MVVTTLPNNNNEEETRMISPQGAQKSGPSTSECSSLADCFWPNDHSQYSMEPPQPSPQGNTVVAVADRSRHGCAFSVNF